MRRMDLARRQIIARMRSSQYKYFTKRKWFAYLPYDAYALRPANTWPK
jgi:hypothetical protein